MTHAVDLQDKMAQIFKNIVQRTTVDDESFTVNLWGEIKLPGKEDQFAKKVIDAVESAHFNIDLPEESNAWEYVQPLVTPPQKQHTTDKYRLNLANNSNSILYFLSGFSWRFSFQRWTESTLEKSRWTVASNSEPLLYKR